MAQSTILAPQPTVQPMLDVRPQTASRDHGPDPWRARVPLAWCMLMHAKTRLLRSVAGIAFAVVLIFAEVGFLNGLYDNQVELIKQLNADVIITNAFKRTLSHGQPFTQARLIQARAVPGVEATYPFYIRFARSGWRNPETHKLYPIRLLAFRPEDPVFLNPDIAAHAADLIRPYTVLIDTQSKSHYGKREAGVVTELNGKSIRVIGTFDLGTDFVNAGTVVMSEQQLRAILPSQSPGKTGLDDIEVGLVQLAPGTDPAATVDALRQALPGDVSVYTKSGYLDRELTHWRKHTPIGAIFGLGAIMGLFIGVMICYQVLYTEVVDHLPQFATLKAIGYPNRFLIIVVLKQAVMLSGLGFSLGLGISAIFYEVLASQTGLLMRLTLPRGALVFGLTVIMCLVAAVLAVRKALLADPAEVF